MTIFSKRNIAIGFVLTAFVAGYFLGRGMPPNGSRLGPDIYQRNEKATTTVSIIINTGKSFADVFTNIEVQSEETLLCVMEKLTQKNHINFDFKDYGGEMDVFINSIASSTNTKDKWWQYFVNGEYANTGISSYKPKIGDVIEFRLTKGEEW